MSRDTPAPDDAAKLLPCPFCGSCDIDPTGWASIDRNGPCCDHCNATADSAEAWNTRAASCDPPPTADAIRRAKIEALWDAVRIARNYTTTVYAQDRAKGTPEMIIWMVSQDIGDLIKRAIRGFDIPPSAAISSAADGIGSRAEERSRASMTLGSSDALMEAMAKALERAHGFIRNGIALGFIRMPDQETPDPAHETPGIVDDALAAFRASRAGGVDG